MAAAALVAVFAPGPAWAQVPPADDSTAVRASTADSLWRIALDPVVVTATKTEQQLEDVSVPTNVVTRRQIEAQGALRLTDVLRTQPGLQLQSDHGTGLQMQGLSSEYVLVLVDGQPVIGRTAGTLDLDRLAMGSVERVEIVRGPSSSLYGSEALAGVVNIITQDAREPLSGQGRLRYGTHGTTDVSGRVATQRDAWHGHLFASRYASGGYDLSPGTTTPTVPEFGTYVARGQLGIEATERVGLSLRGRLSTQSQNSRVAVSGRQQTFDDEEERRDWSLTPSVTVRPSAGMRWETRLHLTSYHTESRLTGRADGTPLTDSRFDQHYGKTETALTAVVSEAHLLTGGAGFIRETVDADRVTGERTGGFAFLQDEWQVASWLTLTPSARLDAHSDYPTRLSPKLAALLRPTETLRVRASIGSGYKAPAFRQLHLDYTNPQVGYSVFGASGVREGLRGLEQQGRIQTVLREPETLGEPLEPERSVAYNIGVTLDPSARWTVSVNAFHNEVSNLIDTQPVAQKTNGQQVFTYFNRQDVFTRGVELQTQLHPLDGWTVAGSYTFLEAKSRNVLAALNDGEIFRRTDSGRDVPVSPSEYGGLSGRSRHQATLRTTYHADRPDLTVSVEGRYRGRYGLGDRNGNGIVDVDAEYAPGYTLWDLTITKPVFETHALQAGVENLTDYTDARNVPFLSGRRWFVGLRLQF